MGSLVSERERKRDEEGESREMVSWWYRSENLRNLRPLAKIDFHFRPNHNMVVFGFEPHG